MKFNPLRIAAKIAAEFSPRPGDAIDVTLVHEYDEGTEWEVHGTLDGVPVWGTVITNVGGGMDYEPAEGYQDLDESAIETLTEIIGEKDPRWANSF